MSVSILWAANTGKISGKVVDAATKEPIPSVNILIVGTTMGATTNADGEYFIIGVPVGTYNLRVTSLGYETQNIQSVQVLADQTYDLSISLKETVIQGQEVTVVAQRDVIQKDVSTTVRSVTAQEISQLPVQLYTQAWATVAGAVGANQNIHIRGGRPDEILTWWTVCRSRIRSSICAASKSRPTRSVKCRFSRRASMPNTVRPNPLS